VFHKAKQNRIFQDVVDQIQTAILDHRLKPGERLPAERELGEMFGTSRGTLREALRVLEQKGLLEIRLGVGGGAFVQLPDGTPITETLAMLIQSHRVSLNHLAEFREDVEGTVSGMAALRATPSDIDDLRELLEQARLLNEGGIEQWGAFLQVDEQIHMAMARISGNPIYAFILQTIHDNIHIYFDRYLPSSENQISENYTDLCGLIEAVADGHVERAREIARDHVRRFNRYMETKRRTGAV